MDELRAGGLAADDGLRLIASDDCDQLLRLVRHELVQPIHALSLMIDLAPPIRDHGFEPWVAKLDRTLDGLRRMAAELSDYAVLTLKPIPPVVAEVDLVAAFTALAARLEDRAHSQGVALAMDCAVRFASLDETLIRVGLETLCDEAISRARAQRITLLARADEAGLFVGVRHDGPVAEAFASAETASLPRLLTERIARLIGASLTLLKRSNETEVGFLIAPEPVGPAGPAAA